MHKKNIVKYAREMIDTPFIHQGRIPNHGLDCGGLVICSLVAAGYSPKDLANYPEIPDGSFVELVEEQGQRIAIDDIEPGDFMLFKFEKEPQHIAIVSQINPIQIIHTWQSVGRVVENGFDVYWQRRLTGCYRLK